MQGQLKPGTFYFLFCILNLKQHWLLRLHWPPGYFAELLPLSLRNRYIPLKLKVCEGRFHRTSPSLWSTWKEGCCILWVARQPAGWWYLEPSIRSRILDKNLGDDRTNTNSKNLGNPFIQFISYYWFRFWPTKDAGLEAAGNSSPCNGSVPWLSWMVLQHFKKSLEQSVYPIFPQSHYIHNWHLALHTAIPLRRFLVRL